MLRLSQYKRILWNLYLQLICNLSGDMFDQAPLDFVEFLYITTNDDELSLNGMKSQTKCLNQSVCEFWNFWNSFRVYVNFGTFLKFYFFLNQIQFWSGAFRQENYYNKLFYTTKFQWRKFHPMEMKVTGEGFLRKFWKKIHGVWVFDFRIWLISVKTNGFSNPMNLLNGYYDGFPMVFWILKSDWTMENLYLQD